MADKVKALKIENALTGGTQSDPYPVEADPTQDYLAAKGISFENSDTQLFDLSVSGEIQYRDSVQTTYKTLNASTPGAVPQLYVDPATPAPQIAWVLALQTAASGSPLGLLLSLTVSTSTYSYSLKYRTLEGTTVSVPLG